MYQTKIDDLVILTFQYLKNLGISEIWCMGISEDITLICFQMVYLYIEYS